MDIAERSAFTQLFAFLMCGRYNFTLLKCNIQPQQHEGGGEPSTSIPWSRYLEMEQFHPLPIQTWTLVLGRGESAPNSFNSQSFSGREKLAFWLQRNSQQRNITFSSRGRRLINSSSLPSCGHHRQKYLYIPLLTHTLLPLGNRLLPPKIMKRKREE